MTRRNLLSLIRTTDSPDSLSSSKRVTRFLKEKPCIEGIDSPNEWRMSLISEVLPTELAPRLVMRVVLGEKRKSTVESPSKIRSDLICKVDSLSNFVYRNEPE